MDDTTAERDAQAGEQAPLVPDDMTPLKLRQLADWFDTYDRLAEDYITLTSDKVSGERAAELLAIVRGKGVQDDIRKWADLIEAAVSGRQAES